MRAGWRRRRSKQDFLIVEGPSVVVHPGLKGDAGARKMALRQQCSVDVPYSASVVVICAPALSSGSRHRGRSDSLH